MWQLLRERPPGYGGVERVAHEIATAWRDQGHSATVFSLAPVSSGLKDHDALTASYRRVSLASFCIGRLFIPLPSLQLFRLLASSEPLHAHLPCPAILFLALIARILRPNRRVSLHWHAFLESDLTPAGHLLRAYEWLARRLLPFFRLILTTSPALHDELILMGAFKSSLRILPCSLPYSFEQRATSIASSHIPAPPHIGLRLISIGRLDSYKRVDWLIWAISSVPDLCVHLDVLGDGPDRLDLEQLALALAPSRVRFHGRVDEAAKLRLLGRADLLVLAANRSNEAFGIVQLEAMACAVPALAFRYPRSGAAWVSQLDELDWPGNREALPSLIRCLYNDPDLLHRARIAAYARYCRYFSRDAWEQRLKEVFAHEQYPHSL